MVKKPFSFTGHCWERKRGGIHDSGARCHKLVLQLQALEELDNTTMSLHGTWVLLHHSLRPLVAAPLPQLCSRTPGMERQIH